VAIDCPPPQLPERQMPEPFLTEPSVSNPSSPEPSLAERQRPTSALNSVSSGATALTSELDSHISQRG